jgi:hypothetical protein
LSDIRIPDAIEPIVGWRYWRLGHDGRLRSLTGGQHVWVPGQAIEAGCRFADADSRDRRLQLVPGYGVGPHASPGAGCTCGLYASRDLHRLRGQILFGLRRMVVGEVSLWGTVIPGQHGYRAQYAYPKRLCVFERVADADPALLLALADYGVPVEVIPQRRASFRPLAALGNAASSLTGAGRGR